MDKSENKTPRPATVDNFKIEKEIYLDKFEEKGMKFRPSWGRNLLPKKKEEDFVEAQILCIIQLLNSKDEVAFETKVSFDVKIKADSWLDADVNFFVAMTLKAANYAQAMVIHYMQLNNKNINNPPEPDLDTVYDSIKTELQAAAN